MRADTDMPWREPWALLQRGEFGRGIQMLRREFEAKPRAAREILRLGIGYMWAEMYDSAATHFTAASRRDWNGENDFAFAGVAEWQLGNMTVAIRHWRDGLKAQYAVGCRVCSITARLLIVASALEPNLFSKHEAEGMLRDATERIPSDKWMGVLGRFILGQLDANDMEPHWIGNTSPDVNEERPRRKWLIDFYGSVQRLNRTEINVAEFRRLMRPMAEAAASGSTDLNVFIDLLRNPEYFIARTEAAKSY